MSYCDRQVTMSETCWLGAIHNPLYPILQGLCKVVWLSVNRCHLSEIISYWPVYCGYWWFLTPLFFTCLIFVKLFLLPSRSVFPSAPVLL